VKAKSPTMSRFILFVGGTVSKSLDNCTAVGLSPHILFVF